MSIASYADLKTTIASFLNRSNLNALIPSFIQLTESRIWYGDRSGPIPVEPLRIRAMEVNAYTNISGQRVVLPPGYLQSRRFYIHTDPIKEMQYIVPDLFWRTYASSTTGTPTRFTVEGEDFLFGPSPDGTYEANIVYYKKFESLAADNDTNWLLTNYPNVYLSGALAEAFKFIRNNDEAVARFTMFAGAINALNSSDKEDRFAGMPWTAVSDTGNP